FPEPARLMQRPGQRPTIMPAYIPRPPGAEDVGKKKGEQVVKREGPFPVGAALDVQIPRSWYWKPSNPAALGAGACSVAAFLETVPPEKWLPAAAKGPATVRIAAIGHGGLFSGAKLSPAQEKLFFDTCNWLLGQDD